MPHEIIYPQGCRPVTEDLGPDELIRRLKTLAHTLQAMGQDEGMYQQYIPLALHLAEDHFLLHQSKDVQLLIACCIADVLRVYAPEAPYKDQEKVKTIFNFLIKQLGGLKDPKDPAFKRYFYLLENLAYVKSFNMCFELEDCQEIFCGLFALMFKIVNDEHSSKVKSFMLDVLCPLITESDLVSNELLDIILQNVLEPFKSQRKNAYLLARDLIVKTSDTLEPYIQAFFNHVLIFGKEEKGLTIYTKVFDLIYELNKICPSILIAVLPQLEVKLKSSSEEERLGAVSLLARMFSEKDSTLAQSHAGLWNAFLGRFNDINIYIRIKCVQYSMHFLMNHPELRQDITETLKMRQHDPDETVRYEVVMAIVTTAKRDLEVVSESEDLLEFVKERTLDKKFKIRKEAMSGLAMIYRKHLNEMNPPKATRKAVTWIKDKILHGYYMTSIEDRLLVERLLATCLVPFQLPPPERMKKLYHLLGTIDNNAMKAFLEMQRYQMFARRALGEWVEAHKKIDPLGTERPKELEAKNTGVAKYLPDHVKAMEFLTKLSNDCLRDTSLLHGLERITDPTISCKDCAETMGLVLKKLGQPVMTNLYYNTIKMLLERCSSVMIDSDALKILITYVEECMRGSNLIEEIGLHPATAGERGLKMLMMLAYVFPAHFFHPEIISHIVRLVKSGDPMVLCVLTYLGKYKPVFEQFPEISDEHGLVDRCKEFMDTGSPKHAKQAVRCLHINYGKPAEMVFGDVIERIRGNLTPDHENYLTAIVAFGHVAQYLPDAFPATIKNIVSRKIVKELLVKNSDTESELQKDLVWCTEEELPFETRCKVEGLKAMARWLLGLKNDKLAAQKTFRMLTAFISKKGDLLQTNKLSKAEMGWLRLAAGCAMLRICEQKGVGDQFYAQQFYTLSTLFNDDTYEVRDRFINKLHKGLCRGLPSKGLPLDFMGYYGLLGFEENRRLRMATKQQMCAQVAKRRDYAKTIAVTHMSSSLEKAMEDIPRILPDYMILFAIPVLTHSPFFTDPTDPAQLIKVKAGLTAVFEPLLFKNDFYCFGFFKELLDCTKSCRDIVCPDDELINTKMWTLCDLAMAILLQKTTNFDYKEMGETRIPSLYFQRNPDPNYVNTRTYIPLEFQYTGPIGNKKPAPGLVSINANRRTKNKRLAPGTGANQNQMSTEAKVGLSKDFGHLSLDAVPASDTQIRLPAIEFGSDTESDQPVKKSRTDRNMDI